MRGDTSATLSQPYLPGVGSNVGASDVTAIDPNPPPGAEDKDKVRAIHVDNTDVGLDQAAAFLLEMNAKGWNIYSAPNPRKPRSGPFPPRQRMPSRAAEAGWRSRPKSCGKRFREQALDFREIHVLGEEGLSDAPREHEAHATAGHLLVAAHVIEQTLDRKAAAFN